MRRFSKAAGLISPRTGKPLMITPRRFRFSIATHMAEEGASLFHIAEVLDHSDTQNVRVYVETPHRSLIRWQRRPTRHWSLWSGAFKARSLNPARGSQDPVIPASAPHLGIDHHGRRRHRPVRS